MEVTEDNEPGPYSSSDDSGSEDDEEEKGKEVGESAKDLLDRILEGIRTGTKKLTAFTADLERLTDPTGDPCWGQGKQQNALHYLASEMDKKLLPKADADFGALIKFLVGHQNDLLSRADRHGCTPLFYAIETKKESMVRWMCGAHKDINAVLGIFNKDLQNCIHAAIEKKVKFLKFLIEKANEKTLVAKDAQGNTPLHLAVGYKMCREGQLSIVELIVEKSDAAVKATLQGDFNRAGQSPYLYHRLTRQKAIEKEAAREKRDREGTESKRRENNEKEVSPWTMKTAKPTGPKANTRSDAPIVGPAANTGTAYIPRVIVPDVDRTKFGQPEESGSSTPRAATDSRHNAQLDALKPSKRPHLKDRGSESSSRSKVDETTVKNVERFLKLHYLRSRSYQECIEILHGLNTPPDAELSFDLPGYSSMKQAEFDNLLSKLRFSDILQYVGIPKVIIDLTSVTGPNTSRTRGNGRPSKFEGDGRADFVYVFDHLRAKGVNTVLKVIVDDTHNPSHSEDAIEKALKGLGIEVWDWKRPDLCSEVIYNVAPDAREVHLYWSGNNAVLRGWAEEGGLKKLEKLRDVHLSIEQGLESAARTQRHVDEFKTRMEKLCPLVTIHQEGSAHKPRTANPNALLANSEQGKQKTKHEWVQCMADFRRLLYDAESCYDRAADAEKRKRLRDSIDTPIRVALIDDGVDVKDLEYTFIGGRTFCTRDEEYNLIHPYYVSRAGHGTIMAQYIQSMCPATHFYVLRLEDHAHPTEENVRQITAKSAAQAIRAAIRMKVHIISMSWTIDPPEDDAECRDLDSAIVEAANEDILMFCSASDRGAKQTATYPSKAAPNKIFTIGAASAWGTADPWVGSLNSIDLTFPGDKVDLVVAGVADGTAAPDIKQASGSSVATALGAGLAALILYCVQVRYVVAPDADAKAEARSDFEKLRKHENMLRAIKAIGTTEKSNHKFVEVWELFGKIVAARGRTRQDKWINLVADVGITLCMKL
ncbi:hypothetical protein B0T16DRAFT_327967 [Cercophora newfieldiana]|uniref:Peptidase S8/S53 domain-containing protein n=1 Tax=Cercophora newfieldiana TaxID=92897 RepID=A0AA39Y463_9PEZI|nr:hypothetical protein B0T16DRAFT_327967 [Cercophora newfieldiana]